jgi:hypothetical protein
MHGDVLLDAGNQFGGTVLITPLRKRSVVRSRKNRSTMLSQDAEVGVKCTWNRGYDAGAARQAHFRNVRMRQLHQLVSLRFV